MKFSFSITSAKHLGDSHKPTAWGGRGRGMVFDNLNDWFSPNTTRYATETELALIREIVPSGRILDLGCGTGRVLVKLASLGQHDVCGLDASPDMLETLSAKARASSFNVPVTNAMAAGGLPFKQDVFDGIYSFGMLSHYFDWKPMLSMLVPYLKNGAPLLFDYVVRDPVRDRFSKAVSEGLGGMALDTLPDELASIGLVLDHVMPQRFGSSADITASWFDLEEISSKAYGEMHTVTERYFENLLVDPVCLDGAVRLDIQLRRLLSYHRFPLYRPAASQLFVLRRDDSAGRTAVESSSVEALTTATLGDELVEMLRSRDLAGVIGNAAFARYLCLLDPFFRRTCDGREVVREAFPDVYASYFPAVSEYMTRMMQNDRQRAIGIRLFRTYRRSVRRWLFFRSRYMLPSLLS